MVGFWVIKLSLLQILGFLGRWDDYLTLIRRTPCSSRTKGSGNGSLILATLALQKVFAVHSKLNLLSGALAIDVDNQGGVTIV